MFSITLEYFQVIKHNENFAVLTKSGNCDLPKIYKKIALHAIRRMIRHIFYVKVLTGIRLSNMRAQLISLRFGLKLMRQYAFCT